MPELPTGTVTFLFTDVEGSTRLLQRLGDRYRRVLEDQARIIRETVTGAGGIEVSTEGDSFFAVFESAIGAVRAAVAIQRRLHDHPWPDDGVVRVRIGLHTGEAILGGDNYVGLDLHRASRISAAGHGGQILLSGATTSLVGQALPDSVTIRDLGQHRLRDLAEPEHLFDLVIEGLPADFPPPRTLDARPNNLPVQLTSFIGREQEIGEVARLLGTCRLLTLIGPGGTGKTRLALEVAARLLPDFPDGAFFVDLSSITDPELVASDIARTLRVPEEPGRPILDTLKDQLREKDLLLVLDNFEQVVEAAPALEELLSAAPALKAVVTSRVVLQVRGEREYEVPPLLLPDPTRLPDLATLSQYEAVRLFIDRADAVKADFEITRENAPAVAEICARLDGLPLAIELAASRVKLLSPQAILPRLESRLSLLTGGARTLPARQRTLRGAIAWSYDLLDEAERGLFARLSVFRGGCSLEAAGAVCDPEGKLGMEILDGLSSLVDKSLLRHTETPGGEPRFVMLETIREFAVEALEEQGDAEDVRGRHGQHFLALAREAEPHLLAEDQKEWLDRCDLEHDNVRAALGWAAGAGEIQLALESAGALWRFWHQRGHLAEGRRRYEELLGSPGTEERTAARAKALTGAGGLAYWQNDYPVARANYEEAVALRRELGDPSNLAEALYNLSFLFMIEGEDATARRLFEESSANARAAGDREAVANVDAMLFYLDVREEKYDDAVDRAEEILRLARDVGNRFHEAEALTTLAQAHHLTGNFREAGTQYRNSLRMFQEVDNPSGVAMALHYLAALAASEERFELASRLSGASAAIREAIGGGAPPELTDIVGDPVTAAREHLDVDAFQRAWQEGHSMGPDKAVAYALEETED